MEISGRLVARSALLNLIGQTLQLLVALLATPFIVQGLGAERYGLLSLAWVVLGYFTVFDLGLGRATTKFVAAELGRRTRSLPEILWTAAILQLGLGLIGALVLAGVTPPLTEKVLEIPESVVQEAKATFYAVSLSVPVVLMSSSFSGALEAAQRFDILNLIRVPASVATHLLTIAGIMMHLSLPWIVGLVVASRVVALAALAFFVLRTFPEVKKLSPSFSVLPILFSFGGWVTVSSVIGPVLEQLERFLIGSLVSLAAVGYYTAPYNAVTRLWMIPSSLTMSLFPAFGVLNSSGDRSRVQLFFARSLKYVLLTLGPLVLVLVTFAGDILGIWLGSDFATYSSKTMQVLSLGVFVNSMAFVPFALLQGVGRADITAKFHLLELPLHIVLAWVLVSKWGITGAAVAWSVRATLDAVLLFMAARRICGMSVGSLQNTGLMALGILVLGCVAYVAESFMPLIPLWARLPLVVLFLLSFATSAWMWGLDAHERNTIYRLLRARHSIQGAQ